LPERPKDANVQFAPLLYSYCGETDAEARRDGLESIYNAARLAAVSFARLAQLSKSYGYMAQAETIVDKIRDPDWLIEESGTVICGSPETCIRQLKRFADLGATQAMLRIDGLPHKKIMNSLELFGKYVIPAFRDEFVTVPRGMVKGGLT
jgi:alkanesulfonate monooxygenase SsuD/methylene tetrahydromethanopterin reductase-like flavin-dependent oxidoreductase (luciferase family)